MFVAGQQLTSLSPPKKPDVSVGFFAVKREIESQLNKKNKKLTIKVDYFYACLDLQLDTLHFEHFGLSQQTSK